MKNEKLEMRDSGVEWIGQVPEGWRVSVIKRHYRITLGKMLCSEKVSDSDTLEKYFCAANVHYDGGADASNLKEMWFSPDEKRLYKVEQGDLLVVEGGAGAGGAAIVGKLPFDAYVQNSILIVRGASAVANAYAGYLLEVLVKSGYVDYVSNKATIPHFTKEKVGGVPLPLPPALEIPKIVKYLDARCGEIEAAVVAARQSIEDYKALKKSLVFETVTGKRKVSATLTQRTQSAQRDAKGCEPCRSVDDVERSSGNLDRINMIYRIESEMPAAANAKNAKDAKIRKDGDETLRSFENSAFSASAPAGSQNPVNPVNPVEETSRSMRDSGVAWIGAVPEGWRVVALKQVYDHSNGAAVRVGPFGSALSGSDIVSEGIWVYNQRVVLDCNFTTNNACVTEEKAKELESFAVEAGDVLITTRGSIGKVAIVPESAPRGILHPCIIRFRVDDEKINKNFLRYIFNDSDLIKNQIVFYSNSTTIDVVYSYTLKELKLPLPPLAEQRAIADYLDAKCGAIDALVTEKESLIADLEHYKKSLIFECVTGKREVA